MFHANITDIRHIVLIKISSLSSLLPPLLLLFTASSSSSSLPHLLFLLSSSIPSPSRGENEVLQSSLNKYIQKQSYRQPPILNAMYNTQQQMENTMHSPPLTPDRKVHFIAMNFIDFKRFKINSPISSKIKISCKINFRIC